MTGAQAANRKKTIVIVECYSSAVNYIRDIRERGYEPVLLELYAPEEEREEIRKINNRAYAFNGDPIPRVIMADRDYHVTLKRIGALSPALIVPGSDPGLALAMRLSSDLGLRSNPFSTLWNLRDKFVMQETLRLSGLRCVRSLAVHSAEEAAAFFRKEPGKKAVVKPSQAAGSVNVFICRSEPEVKRAYRINEQFIRSRKRENEKIIIQEYIDGQEYALDTVSCGGRHVALFGMKYIKRMCEGFGKIYDTDLYVSADDRAMRELVDYGFQVLNCLGVQYGPYHSEFVVDEKGPVLIEVNARPAGAFQKSAFQDQVMQNHETAVALDAYLMDQKPFLALYPERMRLKQGAAVKQICLDTPIFVEKVKIKERLSALKSFAYAIENGEHCIYPKTTDLDSNGGMIYLTSPDRKTLEDDLKTILALEKDGLNELFDWHRA